MLLGRVGRSPAAFYCLVLGMLGALFAGVSGWFWADIDPPSAKQADTLAWHRWTAVAAASLSALAFVVGLFSSGEAGARAARFYRLLLFLAAGAVAFAGAKGGDLVWGEGHLFEGLDARPDGEAAGAQNAAQSNAQNDGDRADAIDATDAIEAIDAIDEPQLESDINTALEPDLTSGLEIVARIDFDRDVRPIFEANCVSCHGTKKKKGGLRLDRKGDLFEGERDLWVIIPGAPEDSLLLELVSLPADDEDRMPADENPLEAHEIETLRRWIAEGAVWGDDDSQGAEGDG
jgi:hypothetical protein